MYKRSELRVSVFGHVLHEFRSVIRPFAGDEGALIECFENVTALLHQKVRNLAKWVSLFLVLAVSTATLGQSGEVVLKSSLMQFSVPKVYCLFVLSSIGAAVVFLSLETLQLLAQMDAVRTQLGRRPRFHASILNTRGKDGADLISPIRNNRIATPQKSTVSFFSITMLLVYLAALLPVLGTFVFVIRELWFYIFNSSDVFLSFPLSVAGIIALISAIAYSIMYFWPLRLTKDTEFLRWLFLKDIFPQPHPRVIHWQDD